MLRAYQQFPVTWSLIILSCFISVITGFGVLHSVLVWFIYDTQSIQQGQVWRLLTPIFLHFPAMGIIFAHLAFNMIWLYQFGTLVERADSSSSLLLLVVVSGIISNIAQSLVGGGIFGGMSGVVYALLAYLFLRPRLSPNYAAYIPDNIFYFLVGFMVLSAIGIFGDGIANTSHLIGFVCGLIFAILRTKFFR